MKATSDKDDIDDADDGEVGGGGDSEHAVDVGDEGNLRHLAFDHILQGNNPQFSALTMIWIKMTKIWMGKILKIMGMMMMASSGC